MQPSDGRQGATCVLCGQAFRGGQRILWRVKENTGEEFGWTATHLLCPRTVGLLLMLAILAVLLAVGFLVLALATPP